MDRATVYTQEQGRSVDFLFAQRATMIGLAKQAQAAFGSNTFVRGLTVTPNSPAALNVLVGIGEIYSMTAVDATPWGSLAADTTDVILKQGLNMAAQTISTPAPTTTGYSINYLIEAQYQDQDTNPAVLPFYNSNNPQVPLNGQGGGGATLPTERQGVCVIQAKPGVAATTGTQVTPTVDAGWAALAVVTVAYGQSTVTASNISIPAGVPQVTSLLQMMQSGSAIYAVDMSTSANTITLALTPPVTSYVDGEPIRFKAANNNTGPCTINWGGGSIALNGANGTLQGGEIIAGKQYEAQYNSTTGTATLLGQTGGAVQVPPATQPQHAAQLQQVGHGQCRLTMTSATLLTLVPRNGNNLIINGVPQQIPAGGVTLSNTGLAASTFYYIYAYMSAGVMTLEASTTGHSTGTNGVEIKTGDATRTLVGAVLTTGNTPGQFADSGSSARYTLSWFNRRKLTIALSGAVSAFTNTGSVTELDTSKRLFWINWADEGIKLDLSGQCINASSGYDVILAGGLDNGTVVTNQSGGTIVTGGYSMGFACNTEITASEGVGHILQLLGRVGGGSGSLVGLGMSVSMMG